MEKYIAFGLYRKNEHGGHTEISKPREGEHVYLAADVQRAHGILRNVLKMLDEGLAIHPSSIVHDEIRLLMKRADS